ncbi:MAG: hypothetical protein JSR76_06005 [Verrucomicrobia bacterium]|nr:hypothetical protein [Verrucomicrobiota bacterium]
MALPATLREIAKDTEAMHKEVVRLSKEITETATRLEKEARAFISTMDIDLYDMRKAACALEGISSMANIMVKSKGSIIESEIRTFTELKASFSSSGLAICAKDSVEKSLKETLKHKIPTIEGFRKQLMEQHELVKKALVDLRARHVVVENFLLTVRAYNERLALERDTLAPKTPAATS